MSKIMRRLESGERWWTAEIALRSFGLVLLGFCAFAAMWLYRSVHASPAHVIAAFHYLVAALVFLSWSLGWCFLVEGPGLFKLIPVPPRHRRFTFNVKDYR
jgi:hypothetical protein